MQRNLVSILIPFKNTEQYLVTCLESIQKQDYLDWEVWAVNDHSTDNSLAIAKEFETKDARFNIITNTGQGIIEALRLAYKNSKGNYITRMDADDIMSTSRISSMVNSLILNGKGSLAIGQVSYFSKDGINDGYRKYETWLNNLTNTGTNFSDIYKECVIPSPCWMTHKEDLDNCQAFIPNTYPEDYDLAFRFYEQGLKCIPCNTTLHYWRDYQTRTSRTSEHYSQNYFLPIKFYYFLKLEHNITKTLFVWGAGKKGKEIAKMLIKKEIHFKWICDNPKKIGKDIYGIQLQSYQELKKTDNLQGIITVANKTEQEDIKNFCSSLKLRLSTDYFFFC